MTVLIYFDEGHTRLVDPGERDADDATHGHGVACRAAARGREHPASSVLHEASALSDHEFV
jgi:hypothetical protein